MLPRSAAPDSNLDLDFDLVLVLDLEAQDLAALEEEGSLLLVEGLVGGQVDHRGVGLDLAEVRVDRGVRGQLVAERHLFGSHEAHWAVHCEGYTTKILGKMLESFGFRVCKVRRNSWRGTYNFEIFAKKRASGLTRADCEAAARRYLANFLVDDTEQKLLDVWMQLYRGQVGRSWGADV